MSCPGWEYATHAEVFALNNALVGLGLWCAARLADDGNEAVAGAAAALVGLAAAHQHAGLLTAAPLAAAGACWLERPRRLLPRCAIIALAAFVPFGALELRRRSSAATAGSWGDLTSLAGLWRHASRAEYGTFRLGAGRDSTNDAWRRAGAYLEWTAAQQGGSRVGLLLAALGAGAGLALERRVAAAVLGAWAFYVAAWHGVWSNLPIFGGNAMAYEVHARFWMQPHALLCCAAGAGAAAVLALVDGALANTLALLGPKPAGTAVRGVALAVATIVALGRIETLYPAHDFGRDGLAMKAHGLAVLNGLPAHSLLLSHSDLHWNPSRYLRTCERRRPDVEHVSLQLLPYPWFARQKRAHGNVSWPDVPPRPSTDVAADAYEVMLADAISANLGGCFSPASYSLHDGGRGVEPLPDDHGRAAAPAAAREQPVPRPAEPERAAHLAPRARQRRRGRGRRVGDLRAGRRDPRAALGPVGATPRPAFVTLIA